MNATLNQVRACAAPKANGLTRCRKNATPGSIYCGDHVDCGKVAPVPTTILLKVRVNPKWIKRLEDAGVKWKRRDDAALQQRHTEMAKKDGRNPNAIREDQADSGTPVFGKDGARMVSMESLKNELLDLGYRVTDIHLYRRPNDEQMATLEIVLSTDPAKATPPQDDIQVAAWKLIEGAAWEAVHVWANGPNENEKIIHTVNPVHRIPDTKPEGELTFNEGLWDIK